MSPTKVYAIASVAISLFIGSAAITREVVAHQTATRVCVDAQATYEVFLAKKTVANFDASNAHFDRCLAAISGVTFKTNTQAELAGSLKVYQQMADRIRPLLVMGEALDAASQR